MRWIHAVLIAGAALASPAMAQDDLLYTYRKVEVGPLKGYDNQPYWRVLAQCAGVHGALANRYEDAGRAADYAAAKARGVWFMRAATSRLQADRGASAEDAHRLAAAEVDVGRDAGRVMLSERPASGYTQEQLIDVLCTQVGERHEKAARARR
jgi:hypothetical protein